MFRVFRVDPECISPDVKNSIHVGDRILEINGTPIQNVPLDEVNQTLCDGFIQTAIHASCVFDSKPHVCVSD